MSTHRCPDCNAELVAGARYCRECGEELSRPPPSTASGDWTAAEADDGSTLSAIAHLLALVTWLIGPLIVMLVSDNRFVVQNAKNAVMWQLMLVIYSIVGAILVIAGIGILILFALWVANLAFIIVATVKATEGEAWSYPLTPTV